MRRPLQKSFLRGAAAALALAAALLVPGIARPVGADAPRPWPPVRASNLWLMLNTEKMMEQPGGAAEAVSICRTARALGYNGVLLWDSHLWERELPAAYMANAELLKKGLRELDLTLIIKMCPHSAGIARWSGDETMLEPRPERPAREERNYRFMCLSHPGIIPLWEEQLRRAESIYQPTGWHLQYNELMVAGQCDHCRATGKTPGQLLASHMRRTTAMCRRVSPGCAIAVWDDMFDPFHNARDRYFHAAGTFRGSWEGVDRDVLILNWNWWPGSFRFWSNRGNRQIISGFYDGQMKLQDETDLIDRVRGLRNVVGWMYTSWINDFRQLQRFSTLSGFGDRPAASREGAVAPAAGDRLLAPEPGP
jgi:hypothetical protein